MSLFLAATATPYHRLANNRPIARPIGGQNLNESQTASFLINVGHDRVDGGSYTTVGNPSGPVSSAEIGPGGIDLVVTALAVTSDTAWSQTCRVTVPGGGFSDFVVSGLVKDTSVVVPDATLVSTYPLDLGSPQATVGPVNGTRIEPWTSTATGSLLTGSGSDASFYKLGGLAAVTLPANNAAHNLTSMSISFYVQFAPGGSTGYQAMFSVGDGNAVGDLSIERSSNVDGNRLRVWHVGQGGTLVHADTLTGITTTNLVVGTAYRIVLTFGLSGLKIYLNDTLVWTIPQNTNGWNNSRVKYLGIWSGGTIPASAVFDHLQIWNGELTQAQRDLMADAQAVPLPSGPISIWPLNETSGTVFDDTEPANVNGTIFNTWADLSTTTMVAGGGGTSVYTGAGVPPPYATFPASQAAHNLTNLTISFYYQRRTTTAKHVLLAAGAVATDIQPGDFSIEVLANGRLRGYHVGQDAVLRFFDDTLGLGITGTDLGLSAHRIDVSFGAAGAKIYLDGVPLTAAAIPANTNGWNNARVKYLGAFPTTLTGPADGAFDHIRLWNRQLSDAEVAGLEAAVTISLTPPVTSGLIVPDVGQFLTNDDFDVPATTASKKTLWASPTGTGDGSSKAAAGNLHTMLSNCTAGAGDTVVATEGYYSCPSGVTLKAGKSAAEPTTLMAEPGAWIVLCRDTSFLNMGQLPSAPGEPAPKNWTLHDAATNTWKVAYSGGAANLEGCWYDGGMMHMLFPYDSLTALMSTQNTTNAPVSRDQWFFSGVCAEGGFAYIRMAHPNWADMGVDPVYGGWRVDNRYQLGFESPPSHAWFTSSNGNINFGRPTIGQDLNPNTLKIYLGRRDTTGLLIHDNSGSFTRFGSGVNSMGFRRYTNKSNHELHRGSHYLPGFFLDSTTDVSNITAHRARLFGYGEHRMQGSMKIMKYNNPLGSILEGSHRNGLINIGSAAVRNVTFYNCTLSYWHEVLVGGQHVLDRIRFVNCVLHAGFDECVQVTNRLMFNVEFGHCYFRDQAIWSGGGANDGVTTPPSPFCTEYWHHNIQDARLPRGTVDVASNVNDANGTPLKIRTPLGGANSNGRSQDTDGAAKKYNNTTIMPPDTAASNTNSLCWNMALTPPVSTPGNNPREFDEGFNNILICSDNKRYRGKESTSVNWFRWDSVERKAAVRIINPAGATPRYNRHWRDYNTYWRNVAVDPQTGFQSNKKFIDLNYSTGTQPNPDFDYVQANNGTEPNGGPVGDAVFYGSSEWAFTRDNIGAAFWGPGNTKGWEQNGSDDNPRIPSVDSFPAQRMDYRPQNAQTGVATAPSVTAGGNAWYGTGTTPGWSNYGATQVPWNWAPSPWRGALDPAGTDMPIGVQRP